MKLQAPTSQSAAILAGMTGEQLTGDMLTATIWGYFASLESHGVIASAQAQMYDRPALTYGLFHAQARPNKIFGIVTTGITFQGLNMDIGHLRHVRWVLDDDPQSGINSKPDLTVNGKPASQNRRIAYNKMRGQFSSAMEHAVPERYWVDKSRCRYTDESGVVKNPGQADCAEAISAVKAIAIAQQQGQKIYTVNQSNRDTALTKLPIGGGIAEIRVAIMVGKEMTFHESQRTANG